MYCLYVTSARLFLFVAYFLLVTSLPVNYFPLQGEVVVSEDVSGSVSSFKGHLFLQDQRLVITHQQSEQMTYQYIDNIAVSD